MNIRLLKHKKRLIICGIAAAGLLGLSAFTLLSGEPKEPMLRREYPVEKGNIIVGVDAAGAVSSEKRFQFVKTPLQIKEYTVKVGDSVKKGDVIAELSLENLELKLKEANEKLKNDHFALQKAQTEKQNYQAEQDKKIRDLRDAGESAYQEKTSALRAKDTSAQQGIAQKRAQIDQLTLDIQTLQTEKDARAGKIAQHASTISALQAENAAIQQKIEELTADAATDHTEELAQLAQKKLENELAISDKTNDKARLETTDYDALMSAAQTQITQLKAEISALEAELPATKESLRIMDEQRAKERGKEEESVALINRQAAAQHAVLDNQISQAQSTYTGSKKTRDELQLFEQKPQLFAEHEGVVLKLGFTPNAVTDVTTPVLEIGANGKKVVLLQVDPIDIADIEIGQEVSFYVDAFPDATFYGKVESKSYLQNEGGKFQVTVSFVQTEQELLDGMGTNATLIVKQKLDVITLSNKAIFLKDGKSYVNIADEKGKLQEREITTGFSNGRVTEILSGLTEGETALVEETNENS